MSCEIFEISACNCSIRVELGFFACSGPTSAPKKYIKYSLILSLLTIQTGKVLPSGLRIETRSSIRESGLLWPSTVEVSQPESNPSQSFKIQSVWIYERFIHIFKNHLNFQLLPDSYSVRPSELVATASPRMVSLNFFSSSVLCFSAS